MPSDAAARELLSAGLRSLSLNVTTAQFEQLSHYLDLLWRWNRHFNLTAVREREAMVTRHLLDSLSVLPVLPAGRILDVGAGAGLPGIPLAITTPDRNFVLLDSNGKKTRFMFQATSELRLPNCRVVQARVETWHDRRPFDAVLSRAFASLADMVDTCAHLLAPQGVFLAMKGRPTADELAAARSRADIVAVTPLAVPGLDAERCVVIMRTAQAQVS